MTSSGEPSPPASTLPASEDRSDRTSPAAPLFVWLLIQMAMLVLAAQRVPLSARWPQASERLAVHEMLVAQIAASALLFPWLLRDALTTALLATSAVAFVQLAAYLAGASHVRAALAAVYVVDWMIGLAMWRPLLVRWRATMIGVAVASCLAFGGALLAYLRADASTEPPPWILHLGPLVGVIAQLDSAALTNWAFLIVFLATSFGAFLFARRDGRQVIHKVLHIL